MELRCFWNLEGERFEDHVVYKIDGEDIMHAFRKDSDIMMDFYKFKQHAEKHYVLNTSCMHQDT